MKKEIKWFYNIGTRLKDEHRDLTITDKEIRDRVLLDKRCKSGQTINHQKFYKYTCNICLWEDGWIEESNLQKNQGCSCCRGFTVVSGINDIKTLRPDLLKYFINTKNASTHTVNSNQKDDFKCPICGIVKYNMAYSTLAKHGLMCPICGNGGASYPEKIMCEILNQLDIKFVFQLTNTTFPWVGSYRYDFYLIDYNVIIETHGRQHYENVNLCKISLDEQIEIDNKKKELAIKNNIYDYIEIDCRESFLEYIKQNILSSDLCKYIDIDSIDWDKIDITASNALIKEVCEYYQSSYKKRGIIVDITNEFHLSPTTVYKYLHIGNMYKWCDYISKKDYVDHGTYKVPKTNKAIHVYKDGKYLGTYKSATYLCEMSEAVFGVKFNITKISAVCHGNRKHHHGYTFKYVDYAQDNA